MYSTIRNAIQSLVYKVIDPGVRGAVKIGITPNFVTTLGMIGNAVGAGMLVYSSINGGETAGDAMAGAAIVPDYAMVGWAGVVIIISSIMDMVDGYMARTANLCSTFGAFYDSVLDRYCELLTLSGLAFWFMANGFPWGAVVTFLSLIGSIMVSYVRARAEGLGIECKVGLMQRPERVVITILGMILCGIFSEIWCLYISQGIIALFANITAFHRILHVKNKCPL